MECLNNPLHEGESARIWRADDLGDIELLHARYISYTFARHTHEGAAIGVIEAGAEGFLYRGAFHTANMGQIVAFNANEAHTGEGADERGWRFRMFYLDSGLLKHAAEELTGKKRDVPAFADPVIQNPETAAMLRNLHISLEEGGAALERESKFLWTFAQVTLRHADDPASEKPLGEETSVIRRVRQYLNDHYTENVTLDDLVTVSGLSAYHLIRVFRSQVGLPPHAYLEQVRVNRARPLLRAGHPIVDVAIATGFTDQSHFSRHFKRMTGVTPGQYRKTAITSKTSLSVAMQTFD